MITKIWPFDLTWSMVTLCSTRTEMSLLGDTLIWFETATSLAPEDRARNISTILGSNVNGAALNITSDGRTLNNSLKKKKKRNRVIETIYSFSTCSKITIFTTTNTFCTWNAPNFKTKQRTERQTCKTLMVKTGVYPGGIRWGPFSWNFLALKLSYVQA